MAKNKLLGRYLRYVGIGVVLLVALALVAQVFLGRSLVEFLSSYAATPCGAVSATISPSTFTVGSGTDLSIPLNLTNKGKRCDVQLSFVQKNQGANVDLNRWRLNFKSGSLISLSNQGSAQVIITVRPKQGVLPGTYNFNLATNATPTNLVSFAVRVPLTTQLYIDYQSKKFRSGAITIGSVSNSRNTFLRSLPQSVTLRWMIAPGSVTCKLGVLSLGNKRFQNIQTINPNTSQETATGSIIVAPTQTSQYTLSCQTSDGKIQSKSSVLIYVFRASGQGAVGINPYNGNSQYFPLNVGSSGLGGSTNAVSYPNNSGVTNNSGSSQQPAPGSNGSQDVVGIWQQITPGSGGTDNNVIGSWQQIAPGSNGSQNNSGGTDNSGSSQQPAPGSNGSQTHSVEGEPPGTYWYQDHLYCRGVATNDYNSCRTQGCSTQACAEAFPNSTGNSAPTQVNQN